MSKAAISKRGEAIIGGELVPPNEVRVLAALWRHNEPVRAVLLASQMQSERVENVRTYLERLRLRGMVLRMSQNPPTFMASEGVKAFFTKLEAEGGSYRI